MQSRFSKPELTRQLDSDGDGKTNGDELGDGCCVWSRGSGPARRTTNISHPSSAQSTTANPSCLLQGVPVALTNFQITALTSRTISLSWDVPSPVTQCVCQVDILLDGVVTVAVSPQSSGTELSGLNPSSTVTVTARAVNLAGASAEVGRSVQLCAE